MDHNEKPCNYCGKRFCNQPDELCERDTMFNQLSEAKLEISRLSKPKPVTYYLDFRGADLLNAEINLAK